MGNDTFGGRSRPHLKLVSRPILIGVFILTVALVGGGAFWLGTSVKPPSYAIQQSTDSSLPVFATVESRAVSNGVSLAGSVSEGTTVPVDPSPPAGTTAAIVTSAPLKIGARVVSTTLLAAVSNRPIFALELSITPYRSLGLNDKGPDVASLQVALHVAATGTFDRATASVLRGMYLRAGFSPPGYPGTTRMDPAEIVPIPSGGATVVSVAQVGSTLSSELPAARLQVGSDVVQVRATVTDAALLPIGTDVSVLGASGSKADPVVTSVGPFAQAGQDANGAPIGAGNDVVLQLSTDPKEDLRPGSPVSITSSSDQKPTTAVPTVAIRQADDGPYVLVGSSRGTREVHVKVLAQSGGWTAIDSSLDVGDRIRVDP